MPMQVIMTQIRIVLGQGIYNLGWVQFGLSSIFWVNLHTICVRLGLSQYLTHHIAPLVNQSVCGSGQTEPKIVQARPFWLSSLALASQARIQPWASKSWQGPPCLKNTHPWTFLRTHSLKHILFNNQSRKIQALVKLRALKSKSYPQLNYNLHCCNL